MEEECCPLLKKEDWDFKKHDWKKRAFYAKKHRLLFHMPIGISKAIQKGFEEIKEKGYEFKSPYMILQEENGFFSARELFAIEGFPKDKNVVIFGPKTLYSKYHQGAFSGLKKQINELVEFVKKQEMGVKNMYVWTADCPKCWEKRGGPTVIIFAEV